jgi:hypothetical protein
MHEITRWSEELRAAYRYRVVAEAETGTPRRGRALISNGRQPNRLGPVA